MNKPLALASLTLAALAPAAHAQHDSDIALAVIDNQITTGSIANNLFTPGQRIFAAEFGELLENFTDEPGFISFPGTFPVPSTIRFHIEGPVLFWSGSAFDTTAGQVRIGFGPLSPIDSPLAPAPVPGFALAVNASGEWHRHLEFTLLPPAENGIYLLHLSLEGSSSEAQRSLPFFIVFNQNESEEAHDAAIAWAQANLLPSCTADWDNDADADSDDVIAFFASWEQGEADADSDQDTDSDDIIAFFASWEAGC